MLTGILPSLAVCAGDSGTNAAPSVGAVPTGDAAQESSSEAWWTGPLVASSAMTLPQGRFYVESYLYDSVSYATFDYQGRMHGVPRRNDLGSVTQLKYGISDRMSIGLKSRFGYDWVGHGESSGGIGVGDPALEVQFRLTPFAPNTWMPTVSLDLQASLPVGRYDRLERSADGFGSGSYETTFSVYLQSSLWMPNGRILRVRLDLSYGASSWVSVSNRSVYGTSMGFTGRARPGDSDSFDLAFEYSATRNWVFAVDFWLQGAGNTLLTGSYSRPGGDNVAVSSSSGPVREFIVAPALEYNWSDRVGVIFGVEVAAEGRNATASVNPVAAFSYFF
jgi:hypothetical protein